MWAPALLPTPQHPDCWSTAENHPPANLNKHLAEMDMAMNDFRLACARLLQEKCYGSTKLGKAIKTVAAKF